MGKWVSLSFAFTSSAFSIGLEVSGVTHQAVGYTLMAVSGVTWCVTVVWFVVAWIRGRSRDNESESETQTIPPSARELSDTEKLRIRSMWNDMLWYHGHVDRQGIREDVRHDKPLNGPCWLCGEPRLRRGKEEHGEVHDDHNG